MFCFLRLPTVTACSGSQCCAGGGLQRIPGSELNERLFNSTVTSLTGSYCEAVFKRKKKKKKDFQLEVSHSPLLSQHLQWNFPSWL